MSAHTAQTELKLIGKLILEGEMRCETGLHVGAGKGSLEIGGSDNPVVKDAYGRPYVPGSSLRGKIRSLLEQTSGLAVPSELVYLSRRKGQEVRIHQSDRPDDEICLLFGRNPGRMERVQGETLETSQATPARLAVFDSPLDASRRCVPAMWMHPSLSSFSDCELLRCANTSSTPAVCTWRANTEMAGSQPAISTRF